MTEIKMRLPLPLDEDGFFRRECPFCRREFKVLLTRPELDDLSRRGIDSFLIEADDESLDASQDSDSESEFVCPYCAQRAPAPTW